MLLEPDEGRGSACSGSIADLRFAVSCASTSITLSRISRSSAAVNPARASAEANRLGRLTIGYAGDKATARRRTLRRGPPA